MSLRIKTPIRSLQLNTNPLTATLKVSSKTSPELFSIGPPPPEAIKSKENTIIPRFSLWWHLLSENAKWIYFHSSPSLPKALSEIHKSQQIVCLFKTKGNGCTWLQETHFTVTTGKSHGCKRRGFYLFFGGGRIRIFFRGAYEDAGCFKIWDRECNIVEVGYRDAVKIEILLQFFIWL